MTTYTQEEQLNIANTIANQMGGRKALYCFFGARKFYYSEIEYEGSSCLYFLFDFKMHKTFKYCRIILRSDDTYTVQFLNNKLDVKKEFEMVYCDNLQTIFSSTTGLNYLF